MKKLTPVHSAFNSGQSYLFECPGCGETHMIAVSYGPEYIARHGAPGATWSFNGDLEKPTFNPSLLVRGKRWPTDEEQTRIMAGEKLNIPEYVCHSFIKDGKIQFLNDCTHPLAGQTVPLEDVGE